MLISASIYLSGCGGKPSEDDCRETINEFLQTKIVGLIIPGQKIMDSDSYILPVPTEHPLTKGDESLENVKKYGLYSIKNYGEQFERHEKIINYLKEKGILTVEEGVASVRTRGGFIGFETTSKFAGLKFTFKDEYYKPFVSRLSNGFLENEVFMLGRFESDKISEITDYPSKRSGFDYYSFKYTKKIGLRPNFVTDDFIKLCMKDIMGYQFIEVPHSASMAKIDGKWKLDMASFFSSF